jgi:hypothetical protein
MVRVAPVTPVYSRGVDACGPLPQWQQSHQQEPRQLQLYQHRPGDHCKLGPPCALGLYHRCCCRCCCCCRLWCWLRSNSQASQSASPQPTEHAWHMLAAIVISTGHVPQTTTHERVHAQGMCHMDRQLHANQAPLPTPTASPAPQTVAQQVGPAVHAGEAAAGVAAAAAAAAAGAPAAGAAAASASGPPAAPYRRSRAAAPADGLHT